MLSVAVLGPVEVRRDGVLLPVAPGKTTELLIRLALEAGTPVRADRLIEELWGGAASRNALQAKVSKLRRALGDPARVSGDGSSYILHVDDVDALRVLAADDPALLPLFRGELPALDWFEPWRDRLSEARLRLLERHLESRVDDGVIAELAALVDEHPLREGLWRLLITALYRAGRQAEALDAYGRIRAVLADELGLDPGPALRELEGRILRQDVPARGNLPAVGGPLIGRDADLAVARALLDAHPLVTLVGPAGVGKTRLAIEVARASGDAWLVRLDQAPVWPSLGEAFGLSDATEAMVLDRLRGLDALLVLDNCEQVADEVAAAVGRITGPRILATSQVRLGVDGEAVHPLAPLLPSESAALFTARAAAQRPSFRADPDTVDTICRSLDGLPLAIELAAARAKALSADEIARRLSDRFALLRDPASRRPSRSRALYAALEWSYDLLFPDDRRGLQALAAFTGGAPLDAAEAVLRALGVPAASTLDVIVRLVERSLTAVEEDAAGVVRYRLLDSVREFALSRLADPAVAFGAHAAWFAAAASAARDGLRGPSQPFHLALVRRERANIDAALAWCAEHDPALGLDMATGFAWAWVFLGGGADAATRMRTAGSSDEARLFAAWFEASAGDINRAVDEVRSLASSARAQLFLAFIHSQQGRGPEALDVLASCRDALTGWDRGAAWLLTAWASTAIGDLPGAAAACTAALEILTPLGDQWALAHAEALLGGLAQAQHRFPDAIAHLTRAAAAADRLGFLAAGGLHRANLGRAYQQAGDPSAALAAFAEAIEAGRTAGDLRVVALARVRRARVLRALGRTGAARADAVAARNWFRTAGGGDGALLADHLVAALDADAAALFAVLDAAQAAGDLEVALLTLDALDRRDEADALWPAVQHLVTTEDRRDYSPSEVNHLAPG
jgi:predicted ATPase/DNA-binding SARP family transcriptional activator